MWAGKFHRLATAIFHRSHRPGPTRGRAPTGPQGGPSALVGFGRPFGSLSLTFDFDYDDVLELMAVKVMAFLRYSTGGHWTRRSLQSEDNLFHISWA